MTQVNLNDAEVAILRANPAIAVRNLLEQLKVPQAVDSWLAQAGFTYSDDGGYVNAALDLVVPARAVWPSGRGPGEPLYCPHGHQRAINCPSGCEMTAAVLTWDAVSHPELGGPHYSPIVSAEQGHVVLGVGNNFTRLLSAWDVEDLVQRLTAARSEAFELSFKVPLRPSPLGGLVSRFAGNILVAGRSYSSIKRYIVSTRAASIGLSPGVASPVTSEEVLLAVNPDRTLVLVASQEKEPILRGGVIKRFGHVCWDRASEADWAAPSTSNLESMRVDPNEV